MTLLHIKYTSFVSCGCREDFFMNFHYKSMIDNDMPLHIKYTSFVSCSCREDFFMYFHYKSMVDNDMPGVWPV